MLGGRRQAEVQSDLRRRRRGRQEGRRPGGRSGLGASLRGGSSLSLRPGASGRGPAPSPASGWLVMGSPGSARRNETERISFAIEFCLKRVQHTGYSLLIQEKEKRAVSTDLGSDRWMAHSTPWQCEVAASLPTLGSRSLARRTLPGPRHCLHGRAGQEVRPVGRWWGQPFSPRFQLGQAASLGPPSDAVSPQLLGPARPSQAGASFLVSAPALKPGGHLRPPHGHNSSVGAPTPPGTVPQQHLQREPGANTGRAVPAPPCAWGPSPGLASKPEGASHRGRAASLSHPSALWHADLGHGPAPRPSPWPNTDPQPITSAVP